MYRFFPLLYEMRNILDWLCASTSLELFSWLRVEQIYATLFLVKCNVRQLRYNHVGFRWGRDQGSFPNLLFGAACIAVAVLAVVLPLYLFSSLNPSLQDNPVLSLDATLSIVITANTSGGGGSGDGSGGVSVDELGVYPVWTANQYQKRYDTLSDPMWLSLRNNLTDSNGECPLVADYRDITQLFEMVDYSEDAWCATAVCARPYFRASLQALLCC